MNPNLCNLDKIDIIQEITNNLEKPMIRPYNTYIVAGIKDTIQNLVENSIYLFGYELDFVVNEIEIMRAEVLGVGEPNITQDGLKIVNPQYIGKIVSRGHLITAQNKESGEIEIVDIDSVGRKSSDLNKRLCKATKNQLINFHSDVKERWTENWEWGYFEMEKPNPIKSKAFYLQKTNHIMYFDFSENGNIKNGYSGNHKYFRIADNIVYDIKRGLFIKDNKDVLFYDYNSDLKKKLIEKLIINDGTSITKEELATNIGFSGPDSNKKLLELKRSLIERDFVGNLQMDEDHLLENIFICPKNQGYTLIGEFTNEIGI